ncbi:6042_t:CDS:2 [Ambispora leptoticha]|uniref:6042_t:CDS:1 n=1 Tax=Ambispora leptoticha TaxID=144679 RepID=A0A9N8VUZ7_9GLOM|nr:6042_t:CDS:2 [Ambispora leptoticha]
MINKQQQKTSLQILVDDEISKCIKPTKINLFTALWNQQQIIWEKNVEVEKVKVEVEKVKVKVKEEEKKLVEQLLSRAQLDYLKLKGAVHIRGVFERWEDISLDPNDSSRFKRWKRYLEKNDNENLKKFQSFWNWEKAVNSEDVANEMKKFYNWLSIKIHNSCATVEWRRVELPKEWSKVAEFMCDDIKIPYKIIDEEVVELE